MVWQHYLDYLFIVGYSFYRGDFFRREFSMLGEVRSLIPPKVRIMALTATASLKNRDRVIKILGMESPCITAVSPHKANIVYWVLPKASIEEVLNHSLRNFENFVTLCPG